MESRRGRLIHLIASVIVFLNVVALVANESVFLANRPLITVILLGYGVYHLSDVFQSYRSARH